MITRASIRSLCNSASYTRGLEIYRNEDKLLEFQVENTEKEALVKATVKGSGSKCYRVKLKYDKEKDFLDSIYCECPAFHTYTGLCKHCVSVLLKYVDYCTRKKALADYARGFDTKKESPIKEDRSPGDLLAFWELPKGETSERRTSAPLEKFMKDQHIRQVSPFMDPKLFGKVRLEPLVKCMGKSISVEFRIGVEKLYVLRDVFEFVWCMKEGRTGTYGKQLQFLHVPEVFTEEGKKLAGFILNWEANNGKKYIQKAFAGRSYTGSYPKLRELPLTGEELEELLRLLGKKEFYGWINEEGEKLWQISDDMPKRMLFLKGLRDGIEIRLGSIFKVESKKCYIYFKDRKVSFVPKKAFGQAEEFTASMEAMPGNQAFIQKSHVPVFLREILPWLEEDFQVQKENMDVYINGLEDAFYEIYLDLSEKKEIICKAFAVYGNEKYSVFEKETDREKRDLLGELEITAVICEYFEGYEKEKRQMFLEDEEEKVYRLLTQGIPKMQEKAQIFISEKMKKVRVVDPPKVRIGVSFVSGLLDFNLSIEGMDREEFLEILGKYNPRQKFYRLKTEAS